MFEQNPGFGYPTQPQMMYNGIAPQQMPKRSNVLTDEEIKKLQSNRTAFTLTITEDEHLRAACNHRTADGMNDALDQDPDDPNGVICKICGQKFVPIMTDSPQDYVQDITNEFINLLQTIKIMFVDLPVDAARQFFDIIPLAAKTPELFKLASQNLAKYENYNMYGYQGQSQNSMVLLNNFMNMAGSGNGFGFQQAQPVYQQQPMMGTPNPAFGGNPFGYAGASQFGGYGTGYQPGTQGFQYNPGVAPTPAAQPVAQEAAPAPAAEATTTETVNVQA
jgi:hypothetical protein